jgi:Lon-like protease
MPDPRIVRKLSDPVLTVLRLYRRIPVFTVNFAVTRVAFDITWIAILPLTAWGLTVFYVPSVTPSMQGLAAVSLGVIISVLLLASLLVHALAHVAVAKLMSLNPPATIRLFAFGDASQTRPALSSPWREALTTLVGPVVSAGLAALCFGLWLQMESDYIGAITIFLAAFNLLIAVINITPAYPFDGSLIVRTLGCILTGTPKPADSVVRVVTVIIPIFLAGWAILLLVQDSRVSIQTASITSLVLLLLVFGLLHPARGSHYVLPYKQRGKIILSLTPAVLAVLITIMLAIPAAILPVNHGIKMPGFAISVEPFVDLPSEHRHLVEGELMYTTVLSQTPVILGQWLFAKLDRSATVHPPESILPPERTQREHSRILFQMLVESEEAAVVVALGLAGFEVVPEGLGVGIVEVPEDSPARSILLEGDIITALDKVPVRTISGLSDLLQIVPEDTPASLEVVRNSETVLLKVPFIPAIEDNPARFGIYVSQAVSSYTLPFPVEIRAQKVVGGPSAGMMFMLATYLRTNLPLIST